MHARRLLKLLCCVAALVIPASADVIIDFAGAGSAGTAGHIAGTGTCGVGAGCSVTTTVGILIQTVTGNDPTSPGGTGAHTVGTGLLTFTATNGTFSGGVYVYKNGTFQITGSVTDAGITSTSTILESGTFGELDVNLTGGTPALNVVLDGSDTKNATLVAYLCPSCTVVSGWHLMGGTSKLGNVSGPGAGGAYAADTFSTDLPNHYVPEPASILLLGTVLVGVTQLMRRRAAKV